jgi:hypothetical protein
MSARPTLPKPTLRYDGMVHNYAEMVLILAHRFRHPRQHLRLAEFISERYWDLIHLGIELAELVEPGEGAGEGDGSDEF